MDKQTLSNYGWLVIVTLILAVMLALATPFGTYVGDAVVSVANGFVGASNEAIDEDNISSMEDKWEEKMTWVLVGDSNNDGEFYMADLLMLAQTLAGNYEPTNKNLTAMDINMDNRITQEDVDALNEYMLTDRDEVIGNIRKKVLVRTGITVG